jgi:tRNA A-37 threonylcarbamoyl transferase component Bud32
VSESLPLIARGREADVFDRRDGTVLRRYRSRDVSEQEVRAMEYASSEGYPVPKVIAVSGRDLILERVAGPTMQDALLRDAGNASQHVAQLVDLHDRLHLIVAPGWLPSRGKGDRLLHLDLHPKNVILGPGGPVVIDWANAARGPAALDAAMAIAIFVTAKANVGDHESVGIDLFIQRFASQFASAELDAALPLAFELRRSDRNVTDAERAELTDFWRQGRTTQK